MSELLLLGATGMVGGAVVAAAGGVRLTLLARRARGGLPPQMDEIVAPPEEWPARIAALCPMVMLNCLGTTIAQAGSRDAFRAVDHDLLLAAARAARDAGARHLISISSVGASARSGNFYLRTKGEVEAGLRALDFDRLDIIRPGLLTGRREGPWRPGESLAMAIAPFSDTLMLGSARRYRSIAADSVARAMLRLAATGGTGTLIHEHDAIVALAR